LRRVDPDAPRPGGTVTTPGEPVLRDEACSLPVVRRVAAMLDLDGDRLRAGDPLPRGWQFVLLGADTRRSVLRADGFPGLGLPMPDLGLPRLMLGGRQVTYRRDIAIGAAVTRSSRIDSIERKSTGTRAMAIAKIVHGLHVPGRPEPDIVETQPYLLLPAGGSGSSSAARAAAPQRSQGGVTQTVVPDETLLFQYSALGFNSHRIHVDRAWARDVEGFPDLVVNGGLATLLLTELLRREIGVAPVGMRARHVAPLFCGRPITLAAEPRQGGWRLQAFDDCGTLAVDIEVETE